MLYRNRTTLRLSGYDYASAGAYFVTICTYRRQLCLEDPAVAGIVEWAWTSIPAHYPSADLDAFVVMPNHIHGIIVLADVPDVDAQNGGRGAQRSSLSVIINRFKGAVTREVRTRGFWDGTPFWQANYYDRVIRHMGELDRVRVYIANNPEAWQHDWENPNRVDDPGNPDRWDWLERPDATRL